MLLVVIAACCRMGSSGRSGAVLLKVHFVMLHRKEIIGGGMLPKSDEAVVYCLLYGGIEALEYIQLSFVRGSTA